MLAAFVGVPLSQIIYGMILMNAIKGVAEKSEPATLLAVGLLGGLAIGATAWLQGKVGALAADVMGETGKGFGSLIMVSWASSKPWPCWGWCFSCWRFGEAAILARLVPQHPELAFSAEAAAQALGLDYELEKVKDMNTIIEAGATRTPTLAVNGEIKSAGKVLSVEEIKKLLSA